VGSSPASPVFHAPESIGSGSVAQQNALLGMAVANAMRSAAAWLGIANAWDRVLKILGQVLKKTFRRI
jgi:hypothetical protein